MNLRCLLFASGLLSGLVAQTLSAQDVGTWGHDGTEAKWTQKNEYYDPPTNYKYYGQTPKLEDFPKYLAEAAQRPPLLLDLGNREYAVEHLKALSRCNFFNSSETSHYPIDQWEQWWQRYGKPSLAEYEEKGERFPEVWKRMPGTDGKPCPDYKILVPEVWSATVKFSSGDYMGHLREEITFEVNGDVCRLRRRYRTNWPGDLWTREEWKDLTREEVTQFYAMLIYAIDHPWLYKDDPWYESYQETIDGKQYERTHILGRGRKWSLYYPGTQWSGILDADGRVIINDDPWSWKSHDDRYSLLNAKDGYVNGPWLDCSFGVVFLVVRDCFPVPSWKPEESRWTNVDLPKIYDETADAARKAYFDSIYP